MRNPGHTEADKPGVIVQRSERGDEDPNPCKEAAKQSSHNRTPIPTTIVSVNSLLAIKIAEHKFLLAHQPVVSNQNAGYRSQPTRVTNQPCEDVSRRIGQQPPGLH